MAVSLHDIHFNNPDDLKTYFGAPDVVARVADCVAFLTKSRKSKSEGSNEFQGDDGSTYAIEKNALWGSKGDTRFRIVKKGFVAKDGVIVRFAD